MSLRPYSCTIRTGLEGKFDDRVTSKEHFYPKPQSRDMPEIYTGSLRKNTGKMSSETTYKQHIEEPVKFGSANLKPPHRFDPMLKLPDSIDWI